MTTRDLTHRASPFAQMIVLVSDALRGPVVRSAPLNATMATPRQSWLDRLDAWAWRQHQKDREAWLAQSKDLAELEARLRALDRGAPMYR